MKHRSSSAASLLQRTQPPSSATQGEDLQGKGVGKESPDSSSITMQKFKVHLMDLPTSIYMLKEEIGAKTKWLQLKESVV